MVSPRIATLFSPRVAEWVAKHLADPDIKTAKDFGDFQALGILMQKRPVAGIVYNNFRRMGHGNDVFLSIYSETPEWATRSTLRAIFTYPFVTAGCVRCTAVVREGNARSIDLVKRLGFVREGVLRRGFNGKSNAFVFGMLKDECRWL